MKKMSIPYNRQCIDEDDIRKVMQSLSADFLTTGPQAVMFEQELAAYTGAEYAVVCANGTAALHMAIQALCLDSQDAVLTSPVTFIADANAARFVGAQVAFADIRRDNVNLDVDAVREVLRSRPDIKVVIPVHFAGQPVDMLAFSEIAREFDVVIVDDACHALGATYIDESGAVVKVGSCRHSSMSIFSFHPIKNITTGEGGAITTNDRQLYQRLLRLRSHGTTKDPQLIRNKKLGYSEVNGKLVPNPWYYEMQELAHNYRISDFQCALGRSQLAKLEYFIERRNALADIYREALETELPGKVIPLTTVPGVRNAHHLFVVRIPFNRIRGGRAALMLYMQELGIQTQVNYMPIYLHPYYQDYFDETPECFEAQNYYDECLSLPLFACMQDSDPMDVVEVLAQAVNELWKSA
ncbi:MAG: UDP-4-amino-4,6-dideoxy-N-acetyl-beta-L-altrosamine transaminase [Chromatiales bacterium]